VLASANRGEVTGSPNDMQQYVDGFLAYLRDRNFSDNTVTRYERELLAFAVYLATCCTTHVTDPSGVTKSDVLGFLRHPSASGRPPSSVVWNGRLACLRSFFGHLFREELVVANPAQKVEFARPTPRDPTYLTYQEYRRLLETVSQGARPFYRERDYAIFVTFYHTGLRLSELVSLDVDQIDWTAEVFRRVRRKGGRVRDVQFNVEVTLALGAWANKRALLGVIDSERALFLSDRRKRLRQRSVERLFARYSSMVGLGKKITPHVLRHTTATELLRRGEDIRIVSEVLNHTNLNTTKRYTHLMEGAEKRAVDRLAGG